MNIELTYIEDKQNVWFHGYLVIVVNTRKAIWNHVDSDDKQKIFTHHTSAPKVGRWVQSVGALKQGINKIILGVPNWVRQQNLVSQIVTAGLTPGALKRGDRPGVSKRHLRVVYVHLSTSLVFTPSYYPHNWKLLKNSNIR